MGLPRSDQGSACRGKLLIVEWCALHDSFTLVPSVARCGVTEECTGARLERATSWFVARVSHFAAMRSQHGIARNRRLANVRSNRERRESVPLS